MPDRHILILAAGKGTRMKSSRPKVLHQLAGLTLIEHVIRASILLKATTTTVVLGHQAQLVSQVLANNTSISCSIVHQEQQLGTAHALLQAEPVLGNYSGTLIVLSGDAPLISSQTLLTLVETHEQSTAAASVLSSVIERPYGYGRVLRDKRGQLVGVVEEADASTVQRKICEVNSGIYTFDLPPLFKTLKEIPAAGPKNERYLPAILQMYGQRKLPVNVTTTDDPHEIRGINSQSELAEVRTIVRQRKNEELMASGVTIEDPATTYIDTDVTVEADTVIHPGVFLEGRTRVGARCEIHSGSRIVNSTLSDDVTINNHSVISDSAIEAKVRIGPFAHIRPGSTVGESSRVGNFVELKKAALGTGAKVNHLSYIGDAVIGRNSNIGAGTITCNYDGVNKHQTTIEPEVFIGSGTELVAPVTIGHGAYIGAGSCITENVPANALALARGRQVIKEARATEIIKKPE